MIPRVVYQTWRYPRLPPKVAELTDYMRAMMPAFEFRLYDDPAIEDFIKTYSDDVDDNDMLWETYSKLAIGAAKADFWRYLVLYKKGGVYLDVDAILIQPLDRLIASIPVGHGLITRETNEGVFNNWVLIFPPKHQFMRAMIDYVCAAVAKVASVNSDNVLWTTGPLAMSAMLQYVYNCGKYNTYDDILELAIAPIHTSEFRALQIYHMTDAEFSERGGANIGLMCYKTDLGEYARCKHRYAAALYTSPDTPYWRTVGSIKNLA